MARTSVAIPMSPKGSCFPEDLFRREVMMFFSVHQELSEKQKPPTHQGGGFQSSGGDFIQ
jgi:hypothetical protein